MSLQLPKRARTFGAWTAASAGLLLLGACSTEDREQVARLALPVAATDDATTIAELWEGAWIAAAIIGVFVMFLIIYAAARYRRRSDDEIPIQTRYNLPIEILYTVAPIIVVLVFFFFTIDAQNTVLADEEHDHEITVVAQQWSWTFNYLEEEAVGGQSVHYVGTTAEPPTLVLPVDETVKINLASPDVIHSFWVPAFIYKLDVIPGRTNSFSVTPTREGTYVGKCAELCGVYHARMLFNVKVVSAEEYDDYLRRLEDNGNVGVLLGGENADTITGLDERRNEEVQDDDTVNDGEPE